MVSNLKIPVNDCDDCMRRNLPLGVKIKSENNRQLTAGRYSIKNFGYL